MLSLPPEIREKLCSRLMQEEGFSPTVYTDTRGKLTLGYGRCLATTHLTVDEGLYLLKNDMARAEHDLWHYAPWYAALDEVRKTVLIDMTFQMGIQNVLNFKKMIACLEVKDYEQAAKEMINSAWNDETPQRCHRLAMIMETGSL